MNGGILESGRVVGTGCLKQHTKAMQGDGREEKQLAAASSRGWRTHVVMPTVVLYEYG
jgi:hypothetical protein